METRSSAAKAPVAVVTGAGRGIGQAIAVALAEKGYQLLLNDLALTSLSDTCSMIERAGTGADVLTHSADVADESAVERMFHRVVAELGTLDLVVSNAAVNVRRPVAEMDSTDFRRVLDVNAMGLFHVCQNAARAMLQQRTAAPERAPGNIVIVSSVHASVPFAGNAAYAMSKAGANQFMRVLAKELVSHGIRVNAVAPGWTDTPGERAYFSEEELKKGGEALPMQRLATPQEIADAVVFLAGPRASYITGTVLDVDGGFQLAPEAVASQG